MAERFRIPHTDWANYLFCRHSGVFIYHIVNNWLPIGKSGQIEPCGFAKKRIVYLNRNPITINYLKLAIRRIRKDWFFSLLNITGLSVGVASFILLTLYVQNEVSYDKFHPNGDRIYALAQRLNSSTGPITWEKYRLSYAALLKERIPELREMAMLGEVAFENLVKIGRESFYEDEVLWANNELFQIFSFPIIMGNPQLHEPRTAVISQKLAQKYFGQENPIGHLLEIKDEGTFTITAVAGDVPENSHIQFEILLSNVNELEDAAVKFNGRGGTVSTNYILMPDNLDMEALNEKIEALVLSEWPENSIQKDENGKLNNNIFFFPFEDIHLKSGFTWTITPVNDIRYVYLFGSIAILILTIACLNYVNLVTARSIKRIKEIGLRKVIGADRHQIIFQTMTESFLYTFIGVIMAFALAERLLPFYNDLIDRSLTLSYFGSEFFVFVFGLSFIVGLASGTYPAFRLTSFHPIQGLSGNAKQKEKSGVRRVLVFIQFFIAQWLIIATIIIQSQLSYLQTKELGYDREHLLYVKAYDELKDKASVFKSRLESISGIESVSLSESIIQYNGISFMPMNEIEGNEDMEPGNMFIAEVFEVDSGFTSTMGMEIIQGNSFMDVEDVSLPTSIIINEACAKSLGWDNPLGKKIKVYGGEKYVVGVIKNFHNESLKVEVQPSILVYSKKPSLFVNVRLNAADVPKTIKAIEDNWKEFVADRPFEFQFYDEHYNAQYRKEIQMGNVFNVFSSIAIFISILGLVGLTAFSAEQRLKEFGIRKVLGAKVKQILLLLSMEFMFLILIAFAVASPIAYYGLADWLGEFKYRININVVTFLIAFSVTVVIAVFTVVFQSIKISKVNPVEILRND